MISPGIRRHALYCAMRCTALVRVRPDPQAPPVERRFIRPRFARNVVRKHIEHRDNGFTRRGAGSGALYVGSSMNPTATAVTDFEAFRLVGIPFRCHPMPDSSGEGFSVLLLARTRDSGDQVRAELSGGHQRALRPPSLAHEIRPGRCKPASPQQASLELGKGCSATPRLERRWVHRAGQIQCRQWEP